METLRDLLNQRAARLQERPALTAPGWGTLSWTGWRARVEGVALGLLAEAPPATVHARTGGPMDWACEVAAACCGLRWDPAAAAMDVAVLGGSRILGDAGRAYHDLEGSLDANTPFLPGLTHGALLARLRRLNRELGWDHETEIALPLASLGQPAVRAALWSALYAGAHARLMENTTDFNPAPFQELGSLLDESTANRPRHGGPAAKG